MEDITPTTFGQFFHIVTTRKRGVYINPRQRIGPISFESDPKEDGSPSPQYIPAGDYDENYRPPSPDYPPDESFPKDYLVE